jgi:hypothetical protein
LAATHTPERTPTRSGATAVEHCGRRLVTETKAAFKTSEFAAFLAVLAGILIAAAIVDENDS